MDAIESPYAKSDAEAEAAGVWVFPIKFRPKAGGGFDKVGLVSWKRGQLEKASEVERAERRRLYPWAGSGMPCGTRTGVIVIDGDGKRRLTGC